MRPTKVSTQSIEFACDIGVKVLKVIHRNGDPKSKVRMEDDPKGEALHPCPRIGEHIVRVDKGEIRGIMYASAAGIGENAMYLGLAHNREVPIPRWPNILEVRSGKVLYSVEEGDPATSLNKDLKTLGIVTDSASVGSMSRLAYSVTKLDLVDATMERLGVTDESPRIGFPCMQREFDARRGWLRVSVTDAYDQLSHHLSDGAFRRSLGAKGLREVLGYLRKIRQWGWEDCLVKARGLTLSPRALEALNKVWDDLLTWTPLNKIARAGYSPITEGCFGKAATHYVPQKSLDLLIKAAEKGWEPILPMWGLWGGQPIFNQDWLHPCKGHNTSYTYGTSQVRLEGPVVKMASPGCMGHTTHAQGASQLCPFVLPEWLEIYNAVIGQLAETDAPECREERQGLMMLAAGSIPAVAFGRHGDVSMYRFHTKRVANPNYVNSHTNQVTGGELLRFKGKLKYHHLAGDYNGTWYVDDKTPEEREILRSFSTEVANGGVEVGAWTRTATAPGVVTINVGTDTAGGATAPEPNGLVGPDPNELEDGGVDYADDYFPGVDEDDDGIGLFDEGQPAYPPI